MQRNFLADLVLLLAVNLLVKPFYVFGIDRTVQNVVGTEAYGTYFALFNLSIMLGILLDMGTTGYNNRNIARHHHLLSRYFTGMVAMRFSLAVVYSVACVLAGLLMGIKGTEWGLLGLMCLNQFLAAALVFLRSNVSGMQHFRTDGLLSVIDRVLLIGLCAFFLWGGLYSGPFTIGLFVGLQTLSYAVAALLAALVVWRIGRPFHWQFRWQIVPVVLRSSLPYALLMLLMGLYGRMDGVLLKALHHNGAIESGIFAQSFRLIDAGAMLAYLFAVILLPLFSRMIKIKDDIAPIVGFTSRIVLAGSWLFAAVCTFHADALVGLLYHEVYDSTATVLRLLAWSFLPVAGGYVVGTLLTAGGQLRELNLIAGTAVLCSVVLNVLLIPRMGAVGAAITSVLAQAVAMVMQVAVAQWKYKVLLPKWSWLKVVAYLIVVFLAAWMSRFAPVATPVALAIPVVVAVVFAPLMVSISQVKAMMPQLAKR